MTRSAPPASQPGGSRPIVRPRKRQLSRLLRGTVLLLAVVLLAVLAAGLGFFPQEPVRRFVEDRLREATSAESRLGGLHVVPLLLRADVRDLRVEGEGLTLRVPRGRVRASPRALSEGAIFLELLELEAPRLELRPTAEDEGETAMALPPVRIDRLKIQNARVGWEQPGAGSVQLEDVSVGGSLGVGALEIDVASARWSGREPVILGPASARLETTPLLDATAERLDVRFGASRLSASGPLLRRGALDLDLEVRGSFDLADAGRRLGQPALAGSVALSGRVAGTPDSLRASAQLDGVAGYEDWRAERLDARGSWDGDAGTAEARVRARVLGGTLEAEAGLAQGRTRGQLRVSRLDIRRLPPSVASGVEAGRVDLSVSWDGPRGGDLRVDARARGEARGGAGRGAIQAEAGGTVSPGEPSVDLAWTARLEAHPAAAAAPSVDLDASGEARGTFPPRVTGTIAGTVRLAGEASETDLAGTFDSHGDLAKLALDVRGAAGSARVEAEVRGDRLVTLAGSGQGLDLALLVPGAAGRASFELSASGPLKSPSVGLEARVEELAWQGARLGLLEAAARGDLPRLEIDARLPELEVETEGDLVLEPELRFRGRTRMSRSPLAALGPLVSPEVPLGGYVSATLTHDVPLERPLRSDVTMDLEALDVTWGGRTVRVHPVVMTLEDGRFAAESVRLEGEGAQVDFRVDVPLAGAGPVEVDADVTVEVSALPVPEGWSLAGSVSAQMSLRGTRERPELSGTVRGDDLVVSGPSLPETRLAEVRLIATEERLEIPATVARLGGGSATLEGEVPWAAVFAALRDGTLRSEDEARLTVSWNDVELEAAGGSVSGRLTVEGGLASIDEPRAVLTLAGAQLSIEGVPVEVAETTVRLAAGRVSTSGLTVKSPAGDLVVTGGADLAEGTIDVRANGRLALAPVSRLLEETAVAGRAEIDLAVTGSLEQPRPSGTVRIEGASVRFRALPQALTGVEGRVELSEGTARVEVTGQLGGGSLQLVGESMVRADGPGELWLQLTGRDVALRYPPGLRSRLDVDLTLAGEPGDLVLAGDVAVQRGVYDLQDALGEALRAEAPRSAESELLRGVGLDVRVVIVQPVLVRTPYGDLEATGRITARGDLEQPAPFGRLDVRRGGKIVIQGREFTVTDGALTYSGDWDASVVLRAETVVPDVENYVDYRVSVSLEGSLEEPSLSLSSEPFLHRQEIASLIATGRVHSSLVDTSAWLLGGQAATLVSGQLTRRVAGTFGLDEITVRPDLVARDTDPSARFTFGKRLGRRLRIIYSAGLSGPETRFVEVEGRPGYDIALRAQRTDTGENTLGAGQRFEWGEAKPEEGAEEGRVRLSDVRIEADEPLAEELRDSVSLEPGRRVYDWQVQDAADQLRDRLRRRGHLDAEVGGRLEGDVAVLAVSAGPVYEWRVEGFADPPDLEPVIREALFEVDALDLGRERLLRALRGRGHLRAEVAAEARDGEDGRRWLVFTVTPGPRYETVDVRFPGAESVPRSVLLEAVGGAAGLLARPEAAPEAVAEAYRARHFLKTVVEEPRTRVSGSSVEIVVPVEEGPRARLAFVRFEGASLPEEELGRAASLETGVRFEEAAATAAVGRVRDVYLARGYASVRVRPELVPADGDVALVLKIDEGERTEIGEIALDGNDRTRDSLVRRALDLDVGDPLDPRRLAEAERRLLNLGVFSRAAIVPRPDSPSRLLVDLEEAAILTAGYDLRWEDEAGASVLVEAEARNVVGLGLAVGGRYRYGRDKREARGSLFLPAALTGGNVTASLFRTEEDFAADDFEIVRVQRGFQVQQSVRLHGRWEILAGYRFRRNTTIAPGLIGEPIDIGGLDLSVLRNTRDDLLDPLEGSFLSVNLNYAPASLGSDAPLVKGYAQASLANSFADDALTWAHSYRFGLARGFEGEPVLPAERFRAGGANSLRGFATNEVGPRTPLGDPAGGEAVVVVNQELRYRHPLGIGGVVFYDVGNVFETVDDLGFDLRHTLGFGLRWASPVGLLRVDVGFPLDPRPDEKSYRLFFSLGQAF